MNFVPSTLVAYEVEAVKNGASSQPTGPAPPNSNTTITLSRKNVNLNKDNTTTDTVIFETVKTNNVTDPNASIQQKDPNDDVDVKNKPLGNGKVEIDMSSTGRGIGDYDIDLVLKGNDNVKATVHVTIR